MELIVIVDMECFESFTQSSYHFRSIGFATLHFSMTDIETSYKMVVVYCIKVGIEAFGSHARGKGDVVLFVIPIPHILRCDFYTIFLSQRKKLFMT